MKVKAHLAPAPARRPARIRRAAPATVAAPIRAVLRLPAVQPMLTVGPANDPLEREAERTAERIVAMPQPRGTVSPTASAPAGSPAAPVPLRWPLAQRDPAIRRGGEDQPGLDSLDAMPPIPADMQEPNVAAHEDVKVDALDAADTQEIIANENTAPAAEGGGDAGTSAEEAPPAEDAPPAGEAQPARSDGAVAVGPEGGAAPADVAARVASPGAGRPLPGDIRAFMEPRFGYGFGDVRLHDAPADRAAAYRIGARAFTLRQHIWLGPGEAAADRRLLAHELTHVVQQTERTRLPPPPVQRAVEPAATHAATATPALQRGWIADKAEQYARKIPGYTLISVLIGQSPITGETVPRTAENLIGGFLGLIPVVGDMLFQQLKETRALQNAFDWVSTRLHELNINWTRVKQTVDYAWDTFEWSAPIESLKRAFRPLVDDIVTFAGDLKDKILEFILRGALALAGPYADKVWAIIQSARETISIILDDPLGFAKNLIAAVGRGFGQFGDHILDHLKRGLLGWLFGALGGAGLKMPDKLDLKGLLSIGLQVVGLTWERFRAKLTKALDPNGEMKVGFIEKAVEFITVLVKEGFAGVWRKMLELIDGFKQTVIDGIKGYIQTAIVTAAIKWLASLTNPIGGIIKIVLSIYDMVKVFIERINQILAVANSLFSSIGKIARGQIAEAANFVEDTMAKTVPVVISFLAGLLGLGGISDKIREIIKKIQAPVGKAMDRLIGFLVKKAKKLFSKIIGLVNRKRKLPGKPFKFMGVSHRMFLKKNGNKAVLWMASETPKPADEIQRQVEAEFAKAEQKCAGAPGVKETKVAFGAPVNEAEGAAEKIDPASTTKPQASETAVAEAAQVKAGEAVTQASDALGCNACLDPKDAQQFVRAVEPRPKGADGAPIEGKTGQYQTVKKQAEGVDPCSKVPYSTYYEADHLPGKAVLIAVADKLADIEKDAPAAPQASAAGKASPGSGEPAARDTTLPAEPQAGKAPTTAAGGKGGTFGRLKPPIDKDGSDLNAMLIYRAIHRGKPTAKGEAVAAKVAGIVKGEPNRDKKVAQVKKLIADQIKSEADDLIGAYNGDKTATEEVRKSVRQGLQSLVALNTQDFALTDEIETKTIEDGAAAGPAVRKYLAVDDVGKGREGATARYNDFKSVGPNAEADHVLDRSMPLAVRDSAMNANDLFATLGVDGAAIAKDDEKAGRRLASLKGQKIAKPSSGLANYSDGLAQTMLLYRPIHIRVTDRTRLASGWGALESALAANKTELATAIGDYARDKTDIDAVRRSFAGPIKQAMRQQFNRHMAAIEADYNEELTRVATYNAGDPNRAAAAKTYMTDLLTRIKGPGKSALTDDMEKSLP